MCVCVYVCNTNVCWESVAKKCLTCDYKLIYQLWFPLSIYSVLPFFSGSHLSVSATIKLLRKASPLTPCIVPSRLSLDSKMPILGISDLYRVPCKGKRKGFSTLCYTVLLDSKANLLVPRVSEPFLNTPSLTFL